MLQVAKDPIVESIFLVVVKVLCEFWMIHEELIIEIARGFRHEDMVFSIIVDTADAEILPGVVIVAGGQQLRHDFRHGLWPYHGGIVAIWVDDPDEGLSREVVVTVSNADSPDIDGRAVLRPLGGLIV